MTEAAAQQARLRISELTARRSAFLARIPAEWDVLNREFTRIQKMANDARLTYRRTVDNAYLPLSNTLAMIGDSPKLRLVEADLRAIGPMMSSLPHSVVLDRIGLVRSALVRTMGTAEIRKAMSRARRALRARSSKSDDALVSLAKAAALLRAEVAWRDRAARTLLPKLKVYEAAIADTIGLRRQPRLPDQVALEVADCSATPRDIYLNF